MRIRTGLGLVGALIAVSLLVIGRGGGLFSERLGPTNGHDLPAIEIDRVGVGAEAPDFLLRALSGDVVALSDFRGRQNVVLVFYRGHW